MRPGRFKGSNECKMFVTGDPLFPGQSLGIELVHRNTAEIMVAYMIFINLDMILSPDNHIFCPILIMQMGGRSVMLLIKTRAQGFRLCEADTNKHSVYLCCQFYLRRHFVK
jgi:hypothetical protein